MPHDLTLGEIERRLDHVAADLKDDLRSLGIRVDGKVDSQVLLLQQQAQDERHQALVTRVQAAFQELAALRQEISAKAEKDREREAAAAKQLRDYKRWLVGAIVVPVVAVLLPLLITRGKL